MGNILHSQVKVDVLVHVRENLRRLRKRAGMSQVALAEASGVSRRMIVGVEGGDTNISLSSLDKLAQALSVSFVDLVRDPNETVGDHVDVLAWRGQHPESYASLLGTSRAQREAQLWIWSLGPGDRYVAEPDPIGWSEMLFVIEGVLKLELSGEVRRLSAGDFIVYSSAQPYAYTNLGGTLCRFVRNVVS